MALILASDWSPLHGDRSHRAKQLKFCLLIFCHMLLKGLLLSAGLLDVTVPSQLLAETFSCRQKTLFTGSRAASLDQVTSDHKKGADLRAVIIQKLTLSTQSAISTSLFSFSAMFDFNSPQSHYRPPSHVALCTSGD